MKTCVINLIIESCLQKRLYSIWGIFHIFSVESHCSHHLSTNLSLPGDEKSNLTHFSCQYYVRVYLCRPELRVNHLL